ncbi:MAG: hypothetical protein OES69_03920 [Myxococcales bacterium]|nr:hypothetical protein [Myxococcales bacterium]MDH3843059.1 hypothetical protein [Myxococcales bacterium]
MTKFYWWMCAVVLVAGCGSESGVEGTGGTGGRGLAQVLDPVDGDPAFAVLSTDFTSSAISLLDEGGALLADEWLTSGSTWPTLVAALSGDVALPTKQMGDGSIVVIDRLNTDVVSRFEMATGGLLGQVRTQGTSMVAAFSSNPHDCVFVNDSSAWVSRYEPSFEDAPEPDVAGTDLLEIDPTAMTLTGDRVDLSFFNEEVDGVTAYARPDRLVRLGDFLLVGLDGLSADFTAASSGKVVVVDIATGDATGFSLPGMKACGIVVPVPGVDNRAFVSCRGASPSFDAVEQRMSAGLFVVEVDRDGVASIVRSWLPSSDPGAASSVGNIVPLDDRQVIAVANGDFVTTTDEAYLLDIDTGDQMLLFSIPGSFEIGEGAYDPDSQLLLIPVSTEGVRLYGGDGSSFELIETIEVSQSAGLGATVVSSLR